MAALYVYFSFFLMVSALLVSAAPARADLRVCNESSNTVSVALGYRAERGWQSEGNLFATAGEDFAEYRAALDQADVDTSGVTVIPGEFTASCFINTDLDASQIVAFYAGALSHGHRQELGGLGLGLAIAKHVVELHGGAILLASRDRDLEFAR